MFSETSTILEDCGNFGREVSEESRARSVAAKTIPDHSAVRVGISVCLRPFWFRLGSKLFETPFQVFHSTWGIFLAACFEHIISFHLNSARNNLHHHITYQRRYLRKNGTPGIVFSHLIFHLNRRNIDHQKQHYLTPIYHIFLTLFGVLDLDVDGVDRELAVSEEPMTSLLYVLL